MNSSSPLNKHVGQPLNVYNIYFILERRRLIQEKEGSGLTAAVHQHQEVPLDLAGYDFLSLPDLPPRFQKLQLPHGWFVPRKNSKRKHVRSHGLTSFAELAQSVAISWKSNDSETKDYCLTVASILKKRHTDLSKVVGIDYLSKGEPISSGPTKETKPHSAVNITKDSEPTKVEELWCVPSMGHECVKMVQTMTPLIRHGVQKASVLPTMGHDSVEMLQQMLPGRYQDGGGKTSLPIMRGGNGCNELEFPIITNVNRRATISNMMVGFGSLKEQPIFQVDAPRHDENGFFGEHIRSSAPEFLNNTQNRQLETIQGVRKAFEMHEQSLIRHRGGKISKPIMRGGHGNNELELPLMNDNRRATMSDMMVGFGSFEEQPIVQVDALRHEKSSFFLEHRRSSAPKFQQITQEEQLAARYKAQELDIADSDVIGMWLSSKVHEEDENLHTLDKRLISGSYARSGEES